MQVTDSAITTQPSTCLLGAVLALGLFPASAFAEVPDSDSGSPAIVVIGEREPDGNPNANAGAPYKVEKSQNRKFTEPLRDTPKTIVVIPKEAIEDMGANSFREVVRSTPGVTLGTGEGGNAFGDRIFIRGFEARNDVYLDGLRDPGVISREIFAVEQIEVVKGPSGNFGGRGTTGGLVSLESKRPHFGGSFVTAEAGVGTSDYRRFTLDANYAASDRFAIRLNGLYHDADTPGRDFATSEKWGIAAAATWKATDNLLLSADYYLYRLEGIPDFGVPFDLATQQPYKVRRENFYGVIGRDFLTNSADIGTFRLEWEASKALSLRSVTRVGRTTNRYIVGTPGAVCRVLRTAAGTCPSGGASFPLPAGLTDAGEANYTVTAGSQRRWATNTYLANATDLTARFKTGGIEHTLVAGGEFSRETVKNTPLLVPAFVEDSSGNAVQTPGTFVRNLLHPDPVVGFDIPVVPDEATGPSVVRVKSWAAYAIDTIKFSPHIWATLGARVDHYDLDYRSSSLANATLLTNKATFANWQASLTWKPSTPLTIYASFATSSNPTGEQFDGNSFDYGGITAATQNLDPEQNKSWEAGIKWETADGKLLVTGAVFQIVKDNAREAIGGGLFDLVGKLRSRGFELGVSGTLFKRLQLFGGYTYTDARIIESATPANVGRRFANVPEHSFNLLATVQLASNFEIGGNLHYQSEFFGGQGAANAVPTRVPGYARLDAVVRWKPLHWLEARVNVNNVTDKLYYDAIYRSASPFAYVAPGRSATLTLTAKY